MTGTKDRYRNSASHDAPGPLPNAHGRQSARHGAFALGLAVSLLLLGCQPNEPGEQDQGLPPEPEVSSDRPPPLSGAADAASALTGRPVVSSEADARADLRPVPGRDVRGAVEFTEADAGVQVYARMTGLEPGRYGFHVHEVADCSDPGTTAGGHFSPEDNPHGSPDAAPTARHAGDLGNITVDESGRAELRLGVAELEVEGERGVLGRSVVLHEGEDDLETQPDGDAGDPIACGVIRAVAAITESSE